MHEMEVRFLFIFDFLHLPPGLIMPFVVTGIIATVAWLMTRKQELIPTPLQNLGEVAVEELETFVEGILGHKHAAEFAPFLGTLFVFIMTSNLIGLIPGLRSPTATFTDCASLALMIFCTTQYLGFSRHGLRRRTVMDGAAQLPDSRHRRDQSADLVDPAFVRQHHG